jgi:pyruvate dehydrogenase E2 component (dihydrolipoamide acetyltransferase)
VAEEKARGDVEVVEPSPTALANARRTAESKATVPHVYLEAEAGVSPSTAEIVRACALALREHPRANGAYRDGRFELYSRINVGIAAPSQDTVVFPTIHDADAKDADEIAAEIETLARRARDGEITQPELSAGTFSVVDLRPHGIARATGVVRSGQAAQLVLGTAPGGLTLSLACDGRILQGTEPAEFLDRLGRALSGD